MDNRQKEYENRYGLILGKRRSAGQKKRFTQQIQADLRQLGWEPAIPESGSRCGNLYFGNWQSARTIFCAYYDTGRNHLFPYQVNPFDGGSQRRELVILGLRWIVGLALAAIGLGLVMKLHLSLSMRGILCFLVLWISNKGIRGNDSPLNYSRNTAAILTMLDIAAEIKEKNSVAFALLDEGHHLHSGVMMMSQEMPLACKTKKFIFLDCVAQGDVIAATGNILKDEIQKAGIEVISMSDREKKNTPLAYVEQALMIAFLSCDKGMLSCPLPPSRKDACLNERLRSELLTHLLDWCKKEEGEKFGSE